MGNLINTDIYDLTKTVNDLQKEYMPQESEMTRAAGINGYFADINASELQNAVIISSELANEMWPARAKYDKNIIAHAIIQNITDINATPSKMDILIGIKEEDIINNSINDVFTIEESYIFNIGGYEFHLPYDVLIEVNTLSNNEKVYTARYDNTRENEVCDITNPYLNAPSLQRIESDTYIIFQCTIYQYTLQTITKRINNNNTIENKTFEFEFENQLASFVVKVTDGNEVKYLTPVFEGIGVKNDLKDFCFFTYIDTNNIRVRFDSLSYVPSLNTTVETIVKTTLGSKGNFTYDQSEFMVINSSKYGYNISAYFYPSNEASYGRDGKTTEELRRQLPKEALSRGSITTTDDLINYFNIISTESDRFSIEKRVDNQFERSYYAYLILKDSYGNVIPTNNIDLKILNTEFDISTDLGNSDIAVNRKRILKPGSPIGYNRSSKYGRIIEDDKVEEFLNKSPNNFVYTSPFLIIVNADPIYTSYYLNIIKMSKLLKFSYINRMTALQFIVGSIAWVREFNSNIYTMTLPFTSNLVTSSTDYSLYTRVKTENGKYKIVPHVKAFAVFCNTGTTDDGVTPYRYIEGNLDVIETEGGFKVNNRFLFNLETDDSFDDESRIKILNTKIPNSDVTDYGYLTKTTNVYIYLLTDFEEEGAGRYDLDNTVPNLTGWSVTNMYTVTDGLDFFINYSDIISSVTTNYTEGVVDPEPGFILKDVPLVSYKYAQDTSMLQELIDGLDNKKIYIDNALDILENNFIIDFKLFNTYGPAETYTIDRSGETLIDRINITLNFEIKLVKTTDVYTKNYIIRDIKEMVEDLNDMTNLHIPSLITEITNKYCPNSIEYIEFLGFNEYGPGVQHLYRKDITRVGETPEFITVHVSDDLTPAINIHVV